MYRLHGKDPAADPGPGDLWRDHLHPEDKQLVERELDAALRGVKDYDTEFRILWKDGSVHHLRAAARVVRDEQGRALNMIGANWDVTESRQLFSELTGQHERLRVTLRSIGDGVISTDACGNVAYLNPAAEQMIGCSTSEAAGKPLQSVFAPAENQDPPPEDNGANAESEIREPQDALLISRDGAQYEIETSTAPIRGVRGESLGACSYSGT